MQSKLKNIHNSYYLSICCYKCIACIRWNRRKAHNVKKRNSEKFNGFSNKCGGSENLWDSISLSIGITCKFRSTLLYPSSTHVLEWRQIFRQIDDVVCTNIVSKQNTWFEFYWSQYFSFINNAYLTIILILFQTILFSFLLINQITIKLRLRFLNIELYVRKI